MNTDSEFFPESSSNTSSVTTTTTTITTTITTIITDISTPYDFDDHIGDDIGDDISESSIDTVDTDLETADVREITADELQDMTETVYQLMEDYMELHILSLSSGKFYHNMIMYITEIVYADIYQMCCSPDHVEFEEEMYEETHEFVEQTIEVFLDIYESQTTIPRRSVLQQDNELYELSHIQLSVLRDKISHLTNVILPEQRTKEWYEFRYQLITASNLWKVFGTESQVNSLIYEKCKPLELDYHSNRSISTEGPLHWGVKYEPVSVLLYEHIYKTSVGEFGCIPHPTHACIGASPDGINIDPESKRFGRMLEIKNIVNRVITGIPKDEYWIQTQIQMETCDLDECDFFETRFKEYDNVTAFYMDTDHEYRGIILHFIERPPIEIGHTTQLSGAPHYVYMPLHVALDETSITTWIKEQREEMSQQHRVLFATKYWYLDEMSCILIQRNRAWFASAVTKIHDIWQTIVEERVTGYDHRATKKHQKERAMSLLSEDGVTIPLTSNTMNPICLIRLDENGTPI